MRYLILIDSKFPYNYGESFLENEIGEIHQFFDRILIFPCIATIGEMPTRQIDLSNVEVVPYEKQKLEKRKKIYKLLAFTKLYQYSGNLGKKLYTSYFEIMSSMQARKVLKRLDLYDITVKDEVYIYSYWLYNTAKMAVYLKKKLEKKSIKTHTFSRAHRFDIYEEKDRRGFLPFREYLLENLDRVFPCSDDGTLYLSAKYPQYAGKIQTSYLGTYDHGLGAKNRPTGYYELVSCSRVTSVKRVHKIVEALEVLEEKGLKIRWTHIGDGEMLPHIKKHCDEKLKQIKCVFLGSVPNTEVYEFYSTHYADIFINVSASEGLPVSIMEAISFGIPVVATDVGGTKEIVKDDITGGLLSAECPADELAKKILSILTMPEIDFQELRKSTRHYWEEHFNAKRNYNAFAKAIMNNEGDK